MMGAEPCLEPADDGKDSVKRGKKNKEEKETETKGQEQPSDTTTENLAAERDEVEGKHSTKSKKSKRKRGEDSAGDQAVTGEANKRKKEHPEESGQKQQSLDSTAVNLAARFDEAEGNQPGKSKKSKLKRNDAVDTQTLDATVENLVAKRGEAEGKQSNRSKSKQGEASAGDQAVTRKDKKRKKEHPVMLEEGSQPKNTSEGENGEIKEKGKEVNKSSVKSSENASAEGEEAEVDGKNDKKKKSKEGTSQEGIKEKEKVARPVSKGKRVSFADSTEVFETQCGDGQGTEGGKRKKKKAAQSKNKGKRVSFADSAEVFETKGGEGGGSIKVVHGVRFTKEEDDTLIEAIKDFIEMKQLGEKGLEMFRTPKKHKELRHCWDFIARSLPHRPYNAIYARANTLLSRSKKRGWTDKESQRILSFVKENGNDWKTLADELKKCRVHVKDTWRRMKSENFIKGRWTQDEHQKLFDLVNLDLRMKAHQIRNPDNRKLRDNISWEAISDKLSTRNHKNCCRKWYDTLASPLVRKGVWADLDDYLLVEALQKDDAICIEDVHWDSLLNHRSGQLCRQRWNQMVRGLGGHREKPFIEQVDVLSQRYCPEMIEYRKGSEETPASDASDDKEKKKSKESVEPGAANAEFEKEKKKSKESEERGLASAEVEKKKKKKSKDSEGPGAASAEVEKEKRKKKKKSKESEEPGSANAEVEKEEKKKKKSKESEESGVANAKVEKEKKEKTDTQDEQDVAMKAGSGKDIKKKIKEADQ